MRVRKDIPCLSSKTGSGKVRSTVLALAMNSFYRYPCCYALNSSRSNSSRYRIFTFASQRWNCVQVKKNECMPIVHIHIYINIWVYIYYIYIWDIHYLYRAFILVVLCSRYETENVCLNWPNIAVYRIFTLLCFSQHPTVLISEMPNANCVPR